MTVALPLSYKPFSLADHQSKISDFLRNKKPESQQPHEMLQLLKALFYSGQFTEFVQQLLSYSDCYFVDSVHICIAL